MKEIIADTGFCGARRLSEAGWNSDVHSRPCDKPCVVQPAPMAAAICAGTTSRLLPLNRRVSCQSLFRVHYFSIPKNRFALRPELPGNVVRQLSLGGVHTLNLTLRGLLLPAVDLQYRDATHRRGWDGRNDPGRDVGLRPGVSPPWHAAAGGKMHRASSDR